MLCSVWHISALVVIGLAFTHICIAREVDVMPNPGCSGSCTDLRVLQVSSVSDTDQIIHLISTFGAPTILTAHLKGTKNTVKVDWACLEAMQADCITYSSVPMSTSAIILYRLIEYDDAADTQDVSSFRKKPTSVRSTYLSSVEWAPVLAKDYNTANWMLLLNATFDKQNVVVDTGDSSGMFSIDLNVYGSQGRTEQMPSILHTDAAGDMDIVMSSLALHFNNSRFGLEIATIDNSLPGTSDQWSLSSMDDEYSPGVFQVDTWILNTDSTADMPGTYIHYKPVSYTKPGRNLESIQPAKLSKIRFFNYDDLTLTNSSGLAYGYYGTDIRFLNIQSGNISIGSFQDGFYTAYNFTTFSAVFGVGQPAFDSMSVDVIIAIAIGVGIPATLIIVSVSVVLYRMVKKRNAGAGDMSTSPSQDLLVNDQ